MKLLLDSKLVYDECLLDFLPNMADPNTQVMYINNTVLKECFTEPVHDDEEPKSEEAYKELAQFNGEKFLNEGIYNLNRNDSDTKVKQVHYYKVTISEVLSREFLEQVCKNGNIELFRSSYLIHFKEAEWLKHYNDIRMERLMHYFNILLMIINIYFLHVSSNDVQNDRCADQQYCF